jgi:hypothetical protein
VLAIPAISLRRELDHSLTSNQSLIQLQEVIEYLSSISKSTIELITSQISFTAIVSAF